MKKKISPLTCFAIVSTSKPKLKLIDIYETEDVVLEKGEKLIRVVITVKE